MSEENVEIVRRLHEAAARRDTETAFSLYHPDVVWDYSRGEGGAVLGRRVYHGHEGVRTVFRNWYEAWDDVEADVEQLVDAGDKVISVVTNRGRGRTSDVEVEWRQHAVWTIKDGRISHSAWFTSRKEALEAAGLSE